MNLRNNKCTLVTTRYQLKPGSETVYEQISETIDDNVTQEQYDNIVNATPFFRRLGGSETVTKANTSAGHGTVLIVSESPDRSFKTVRDFKFKYIGGRK
jgi:hypothetical protein